MTHLMFNDKSAAYYLSSIEKLLDDTIVTDDSSVIRESQKGMMIMGFAGTQNVDTNDGALLACDTSGRLQVRNILAEEKLDTLETTLTAIETDAAALEVLVTATNTKLDTIDSVLDTIKVDTEAIETAVEILDNCVSGNEMQVDIVASLPAGTNLIGNVNVTSIIPDTGATNLGKAIQSAQGSTDTGVAALVVRNDTLADLAGADHDYAPLQVNASGALYTEVNSSALPTGASTSANQSTIIGHIDGIETLLGTIDSDTNDIKTSVELLDDCVVTDDAAVTLGSQKGLMIMGFAGTQSVNSNDGALLACDTSGHLQIRNTTAEGKLDTLETTLTAIETDAAALEVLVTATNSKLDTIDGVLDTIKVDTEAIETAVEILDNCVSGNEMQVDVITSALPSGASTAANQSTIIGHVDGIETLLGTIDSDTNDIKTSVELLDDCVVTDDAAVTLGSQKGLMIMGFAGTQSVNANDGALLACDTSGHLQIRNSTAEGKLDTLETTLTAIETDAAALEVLQTSTNTKLDTIETTLTAIETDAAALEVLVTATNSKLDTIKVDTEAIETAVEILDNCVSGNEMQVDVITSALPSGASTSANQSTIIGHVDGIETLLGTIDSDTNDIKTAVQILDNCVATEDSATTPKGNLVMGRYDTSSRSLDNGDAGGIAVDVDGSVITTSYMQTSNSPTTLKNNATFSANTFTSELDLLVNGRYYKDVTIYGTTTTATAKFHFALGHTSGTSNHFIHSDYATLTQRAATGVYHFVHSIKDVSTRYVCVYNDNSGDAAAVYMYAMISSH